VANYASFKPGYVQRNRPGQSEYCLRDDHLVFLRSKPPESITLEGAHDFNSGKETGSSAPHPSPRLLTSANNTLATAPQNVVQIG